MRRCPDLPAQRGYRFRLTGLVYLAVTGFLAVAAISSQNNLLFWSLGLAVAGIGVSGVISGLGLMGLRAEREPIADGAVGRPMVIRYRIRNTNLFAPAFGLTIAEREPPRRRRARTPWQRCCTRPVAFVSCIRPGQTVIAEARPLATRRGQPEFTDFSLASAFPFGLATKILRFTQARTALVHPAPTPVDPRVLDTAAAGAGREGVSRSLGNQSGDFYGLREYIPGDSLRAIAWRASARLDELVIRQHAAPVPTRLWVRLELDGAADEDEAERTISLAAGVISLAAEQGFAVGLICPDYAAHTAPSTGRTAVRQTLAQLALIPADGQPRAEADPEASTNALPEPRPHDLVVVVRPRAGGSPLRRGALLTLQGPSQPVPAPPERVA